MAPEAAPTSGDSGGAAAAAAAAEAEEPVEERACRYCFEGEEAGELISPCRCSGGQKWVHLACLRRWQRGVLVSQPTHPDFYDDDDVRHRVCNVCKADFTCKPPTLLELMRSFTGEELAALVEEGCIISSSKGFSDELRRQVNLVPVQMREELVDSNWVDGVFLIVQVVEDRGAVVHLQIKEKDDLVAFASQLTEDWIWQMRGRPFRLLFAGPLEEVAGSGRQQRLDAIQALQLPCSLRLESAEEADCGEDGIMAVGLTRPITISSGAYHLRRRLRFQAAVKKAIPSGEDLLPAVTHFVGGPCQKDTCPAAIVISGLETYQVHLRLPHALKAAQELCKARSSADSEAAESPAKRQRTEGEVSTSSSSTSQPLPAPSCSGGGSGGSSTDTVRVHVFWGTAGWSRCQLMGEIASGSWGLCRSSKEDVTTTPPQSLYEAIYPRLIFAPRTEMSEDYGNQEAEASNEAIEAASRARLRVLRRRIQRREEEARLFEARQEGAPQATPTVDTALAASPQPQSSAVGGGTSAGGLDAAEEEEEGDEASYMEDDDDDTEDEDMEEEGEEEVWQEEDEEEADADEEDRPEAGGAGNAGSEAQ